MFPSGVRGRLAKDTVSKAIKHPRLRGGLKSMKEAAVTRLFYALIAGFAILFGGSNPVLAQDTAPVDSASGTSEPSRALRTFHDNSYRQEQFLSVDLGSTVQLDTYRHLRDVRSGQDRNVDALTLGFDGQVGFLINQDSVKNAQAEPIRLTLRGMYSYTSDNDGFQRRSLRGVSQLDQYTAGGQAGISLNSAADDSTDIVRLRLDALTGVAYHNWGQFYGTMWWSTVRGDFALALGNSDSLAIGPAAGFLGDLKIGEHQSNQLYGEVSVGLDGSTESFSFSIRGLATAYMGDANTVTGQFAKIERQNVRLGARASLTVGNFLEFSATWTHPLYDNVEVDQPNSSVSSTVTNEGTDLFSFSVTLRF